MIKRAIISSLLSAGCDVLDLRSAPIPVARHLVKASGAAGGIHTRKLPSNARVTSIELFDSRGAYLSRSAERKVETAFFREDFRRIDPDDLGVIDYAGRALEWYQNDFFAHIPGDGTKGLKLVADYGYSPVASMYPPMLDRLGIESIALNVSSDAKLAPRTTVEIEAHVQNLQKLIGTLGYQVGLLFTDDGERLTMVDDRGRVVNGYQLLGAMCVLAGKTHSKPSVAMSVAAPQRLESALSKAGVSVVRTRMDSRSLMNTALDANVTFAGDERGGFIFPEFHPGFDAPYAFGKLNWMLQKTGLRLSEVVDSLPPFHLAYEQVACPTDSKGAVMRQLSESARLGERVELVDGIKIYDSERWVLILPDAVEPLFHVYAETDSESESKSLVSEHVTKIQAMVEGAS